MRVHLRSLFAFRYRTGGPVAGLIFCIIATVDVLFLYILDHLAPRESIDQLP